MRKEVQTAFLRVLIRCFAQPSLHTQPTISVQSMHTFNVRLVARRTWACSKKIHVLLGLVAAHYCVLAWARFHHTCMHAVRAADSSR